MSARRVFGHSYCYYSAPVLESRHIRPRSKMVSFWSRVLPEAKHPFYASVLLRTEAVSLYYCLVLMEPRPKTFKIKKTNSDGVLEFSSFLCHPSQC